jgi:hypothetical protein
MTFEQQKAELKRKIMEQPSKKPKAKKLKKDTIYNPERKLPRDVDLEKFMITRPPRRSRRELNANARTSIF